MEQLSAAQKVCLTAHKWEILLALKMLLGTESDYVSEIECFDTASAQLLRQNFQYASTATPIFEIMRRTRHSQLGIRQIQKGGRISQMPIHS